MDVDLTKEKNHPVHSENVFIKSWKLCEDVLLAKTTSCNSRFDAFEIRNDCLWSFVKSVPSIGFCYNSKTVRDNDFKD